MKYIDADKLKKTINKRLQENADNALLFGAAFAGRTAEDNDIINLIDSLQQEHEIVEFSFKGGTYRENGEEHAFKGGKVKVIILEINKEEENK